MQRFSSCFAPAHTTICCFVPFQLRAGLSSSKRGLDLAPTERLALPWFREPTAKHPFPFRPVGPVPCAPCTGTRLPRTGIRSPGPRVTRTWLPFSCMFRSCAFRSGTALGMRRSWHEYTGQSLGRCR
eukprot:240480-Prymnesium_polylepis.1